jgi:hypothetical protein
MSTLFFDNLFGRRPLAKHEKCRKHVAKSITEGLLVDFHDQIVLVLSFFLLHALEAFFQTTLALKPPTMKEPILLPPSPQRPG